MAEQNSNRIVQITACAVPGREKTFVNIYGLGTDGRVYQLESETFRQAWRDAASAVLLAAGVSLSEAKPTLGDTQAVLPQAHERRATMPAKCAKGTHFVVGIGEAGWWCKDCGVLARGWGPVEVPTCWAQP